MLKLVPIFLFALIVSNLSDYYSKYSIDRHGAKTYIYKEKFFYMLLALAMALFAGLRTSGNDTFTYRYMYSLVPSGVDAFRSVEWTRLASSPGMFFVIACLKMVNASVQNYLMVFALFTILTYLRFIRKYTCDIPFSTYLFFTMGVYTFAMAAIKQTTAVAFLLIATDRAIEGKKTAFLFWLLIAELFHPYAFVYLVVPFLFFNPWTNKTYWLLLGTVLTAISLQVLLEGILNITDALGAGYSVSELSGAGVNIFRVLVVWIPPLLSFFAKDQLRENNDRVSNLIINLSMINAMIMFIGLFGTANYFARLANYFLIFQTLSLPWLMRYFNFQSRRFLKAAATFAYFLYFYYGEAVANGSFDSQYRFLTLSEYFKTAF